MTCRFPANWLPLLLALLVPLQAIAAVDRACCHDARADTLAAPAVHAHHGGDHAEGISAPAPEPPHAVCDSNVLPCCHASTLAAPTVFVPPALTGKVVLPAIPQALVVAPPRSGPDRPPRPRTS